MQQGMTARGGKRISAFVPRTIPPLVCVQGAVYLYNQGLWYPIHPISALLLSTYLRPQRGGWPGWPCCCWAASACNCSIRRSCAPSSTRRHPGSQSGRWPAIAALFLGLALVQQAALRRGDLCQRARGLDGDQRPARRPGCATACSSTCRFHKARTPGELIERIDGDVTALANFFSQFVIQVLGSLLLLLGVLVVLWTVDWRVGRGPERLCPRRRWRLMLRPARHRRAATGRRPPGQRRAVRLHRRAAGGHGRHPRQRRRALRHAPPVRAHARALPHRAHGPD